MLLSASRRPKKIRTLPHGLQAIRKVTTAHMTHSMWLTNLASEIQEAILFLPRVELGPDTVREIEVRWIARVMDCGVQRSWLMIYSAP